MQAAANIIDMDKEDVKAALRKRFGSVSVFEREKGLPDKSVSDLLRGRASARVLEAVKEAINEPISKAGHSEVSEDSADSTGAHRLFDQAR